MADDPNQRGKPDRSRINVNERYEVAYWTTVLRVTEEKLKEAVAKVGVMTADVRKYLGR